MGQQATRFLSNFTRKKTALVPLFFYCLLINYLVLHTPFVIFEVADVTPVQPIYALESQIESPASLNSTGWKLQSLPDDWYINQHATDQIWYRSRFSIDQIDNQIWAVYLPAVTHNAAVFINGIWVGQGGGFDDPVSRHHNEPLLFSFSPEMLRPGNNQIDLRVKTSFTEQGLLAPFYIAPLELLEPAYVFKHFVRVELIKWLTTSMYLMALVVFAFWWARPQDKIYGIFALELTFWATHNLNLIISDIPISARLWEALSLSTFGWTIITMIFFNHRYAGGAIKWVEKLLLLFAASGLGLFLLPELSSVLFAGYRLWDSFLLLVGAYAMFHLLKLYWHHQDRDVFLMLLVGVPIMVFGLHDYLMLNHFGDRQDGLIIQFSVIPAVILFSWFMIRRFVRSINEAEQLAQNLEQRVQHNTQEIQAQYDKLKKMEKQTVLADERERIMRDMHDGIGGQLISVISMLQDRKQEVFIKIREKVQLSLADLRFVIDSLDPLHHELPTLLGMMRLRLHDQLESADIELEWAVTDLPEIPDMSPGRSLHIMRIVQEAITNCIKHANSKKMTLATGTLNQGEPQVYIDIIDYGIGFKKDSLDRKTPGRGVENMQYRARQMRAELDLDSSEEGTRVRLLISLTPV